MELDPASAYAPYFGGVWHGAGAARHEERSPLFQRAVRLDPAPRLRLARLSAGPTSTWIRAPRRAGVSRRPSRSRARREPGPTAGVAGYLGRVPAAAGRSRTRRASRCLEGLAAVGEIGQHVPRHVPRRRPLRSRPHGARAGRPAGGARRVLAGRRCICAAGRAASAAATCSSRRWPGSRAAGEGAGSFEEAQSRSGASARATTSPSCGSAPTTSRSSSSSRAAARARPRPPRPSSLLLRRAPPARGKRSAPKGA